MPAPSMRARGALHAPYARPIASCARPCRPQNLSQLPGISEPPSTFDHFTTTNSIAFGGAFAVPAVGATRHGAAFKSKLSRSDIFAASRVQGAAATESTAAAFARTTASASRRPQPRFVHGGAYRNRSQVALDRNLVASGGARASRPACVALRVPFTLAPLPPPHPIGGAAPAAVPPAAPSPAAALPAAAPLVMIRRGPPCDGSLASTAPALDFCTSDSVHFQWQRQNAPRPTHQFNLPHKNGSSLDVYMPETQRAQRNAAGPLHYTTSHTTQFTAYPGTTLMVPPGKGGVDMTRSSVPLGVDDYPTERAHTATAFVGTGLDCTRASCPSRGTLGARL